jgi:acyl-CoA synthetase (AMP-forming)/AMP-acid ligase II
MFHSRKNLGNLIDLTKDLTKVAVIDSKGRQYTYQQINDLANAVANELSLQGYKSADRIAIIAFNSIEFIATYLGILKLGAVVVLINAKAPQEQIEYILNDSVACLIFTDRELVSTLPIKQLDTIHKFANTQFNAYDPADTDPAIFLYTSGSTGNPKGVMISHKNHLWMILGKARDKFMPQRRMLVAAPCYHMNGLSNMETALAGYATLILMPKFDARECLTAIATHRVNSISSVPTMIALMLKETDLVSTLDLTCIRHILMGSAPVSKSLYDSIKQTFPNVIVTIAYGLTEVGPGLFGRHATIPTPEMSVGYPIQGIDYRLVDSVLQIKSPSMMMRYNNIDTASITQDGFFITNDLFRTDENGFYYFEGRADDMFVSGGNNIYPRQVEIALESHPAVMSAAVIGLDDDVKGVKPYAFVVLKQSTTIDSIKNHALTKLAPSHCPRQIWIIDTMPLNGVNKVDKKKLQDHAQHLLSSI